MAETTVGSRRGVRGFLLTFASLVLLAAGCSDPLANPDEAAQARAHLETLLDLMEANSVNRKSIDWTSFRSTVIAAALNPQDLSDTFDAIFIALGLLGDNHSSYTAPPVWGLVLRNSAVTCTASPAATFSVPSDIGYVRVTAVSGSAALATSFAMSLQATIRTRDVAHPVGWIVDLRGNTGGNMWPMIAGLGPILGDRTLGYFIDPDGIESEWEYQGGLAILNNLTVQAVTDPYTLSNPDPRVAVLLDGRVASSGEATAIAFKGRPNTRFFGTPSCGLSTANSTFSIEGASLVLTVATIADRNRFAYGDTLPPDEVITDEAQLRQRAIDWLRGGSETGYVPIHAASR